MKTLRITHNGETMTIPEWAEKFKTTRKSLDNRKAKLGSYELAIADIEKNGIRRINRKSIIKRESPYKTNLYLMFAKLQRGQSVCEQALRTATLSGFWAVEAGRVE